MFDGRFTDLAPPVPASTRLRRALVVLLGRIQVLHGRIRQRHQLRRMAEEYPDHLLRDVGLRRKDLLREAARPLWR